MITRTETETEIFARRAAEWTRTHIEPLAAMIRDYASKRGRGQPPVARVFLRDVADQQAETIALETLSQIVLGLTNQASLTATAAKVANAVARAVGARVPSQEKSIQIGFVLIGLVADSTGAVAIETRHGDNPQKVTGGVKISPSYELRVKDETFLAAAVAFGKVGMPSYTLGTVQDWTAQDSGGVEGQAEQGMVHSAGEAMRGITPARAPGLFAALNTAQAARFRVNPAAAVFLSYDPAKAYAWLLERFLADGMPQAAAEQAAREAARL